MTEEWTAVYKFARLCALALTLAGIAFYVYAPSRRKRLEEPALRMLEEERGETRVRRCGWRGLQ
jgi:cbb3-type cytochrome oxidase subunit 3